MVGTSSSDEKLGCSREGYMLWRSESEQSELRSVAKHILETGEISELDMKQIQTIYKHTTERKIAEEAARHLALDYKGDAQLRMLEHGGFYL